MKWSERHDQSVRILANAQLGKCLCTYLVAYILENYHLLDNDKIQREKKRAHASALLFISSSDRNGHNEHKSSVSVGNAALLVRGFSRIFSINLAGRQLYREDRGRGHAARRFAC